MRVLQQIIWTAALLLMRVQEREALFWKRSWDVFEILEVTVRYSNNNAQVLETKDLRDLLSFYAFWFMRLLLEYLGFSEVWLATKKMNIV